MAKSYTFKPITKENLRWHPELGAGDNRDNYFEYIWFDGPLKSDENEEYFIRIDPFSSLVNGSHGAEEGGLPGIGFEIILPDKNVLDTFEIYSPKDFEPYEFGGNWAGNILKGTYNDKGLIEEYEINMEFLNIKIDLKAKSVAHGVQFVENENGYTYFHPIKERALGWWPLVPRAEVEGTLTVDGKKINVKGPAYLDRQVGNLPVTFGGSGQAWWTWGHFWAGDYTATFTDSAPTSHYKYKHFSPFVLWKGSEIVLATYNFTGYIEQYAVDEATSKFIPKVLSQRASDGSVNLFTQIENGIISEPTTTSLESTTKYCRQLLELSMQLNRFGGINAEASGKAVVEFGAGMHFMPWDRIFG